MTLEWGPINVVLAVAFDEDAYILDYFVSEGEEWSSDPGSWIVGSGHCAADNGFENLPTEPGLYNCKALPRWVGSPEGDDGEMMFRVISAERLASIFGGEALILRAEEATP